MKKIRLVMSFAIAAGLLFTGPVMIRVATAADWTKCPVMGLEADPKQYVDYKGKRINLCCSGCESEFKKDPEKYVKKMEAEGQTGAATPAK